MALEARSTQIPITVVETSAKAARATQIPVTLVYVPIQPARATQVPITVVYTPFQPARATQIPVTPAFILDPTPPAALRGMWPGVERWVWKTTIVKSFSGKEQRMALRDEPFIQMEYDLALLNDQDRQTLLYTFDRYIGKRLNFPLQFYTTKITATAAIGATELIFDPAATNCRDGEPVAIFNSDFSIYRILETSSVTATGIQLATALEEAVDADLYVAPAPLCRIGDSQSFNMGRLFGAGSVVFEVVPPRDILRPDQGDTVQTFDSMPLLPDRFLNPANHSESIAYNLETLNNEMSDPADRRSWLSPQIKAPRSYVIDKTDLDHWRKFADLIKGRRSPFLVPSFRSDFSLSVAPALNADVLVTTDNYVADYFKWPQAKYLRLVTANGVIYRKILQGRLNLDRTVDIYLETPLGGSVGDNEISMISIMYKVRLASDTIEISHYLNYVEIAFSIATVNE